MCNSEECAKYFKEHREYTRCFLALRKKWEALGRVSGTITLEQASEEECRAIGRIIGKRLSGDSITFSFPEFEQGLQKTKFAPVDMKEVLEYYYAELLISNRDAKKESQERKQDFFERLCTYFTELSGTASDAFLWIKDVCAFKRFGYQILIKEYGRNEKQAEELAKNVGTALMLTVQNEENGKEVPLAVFAAELSGNPHYFDRGTAGGQLLISAICWKTCDEYPKTAYRWRELLLQSRIVPDNVSSFVHAYGLRLKTKAGYHPAYDEFCSRGEPYVITLESLKNICGVGARKNRVYIVENEMVFSYLIDKADKYEITVLCTSGQPRAAAFELFSLMTDAGISLYYSGDMDPEGIDIADRLWKKYGESIHIWRMSPSDYERGLSRETIDSLRMVKLEKTEHPVLKETVMVMKEKRLSAYQENILDDFLGDISQG